MNLAQIESNLIKPHYVYYKDLHIYVFGDALVLDITTVPEAVLPKLIQIGIIFGAANSVISLKTNADHAEQIFEASCDRLAEYLFLYTVVQEG